MNNVKILFSTTLFSLALFSFEARAENRTFTSKDGKTMEAELVALDDPMVTVKLPGHTRLVRFPLDQLAAEDQEAVRQWAMENKSYSIRIDASKKMKGSENSKSGSTKTNERSYVYSVSLNNWGRDILEDVSVRYRVFTDGGYEEGNHAIEMLEEKMTESFETIGSTLKRSETVKVSTGSS